MSARFPALISVLRFALKNNELACHAPSNKFSRNVLKMLRDNGYIAGFSFFKSRPYNKGKEIFYRGFPKVVIFLKKNDETRMSIIKIPRLYPMTHTNFRSIKFRNFNKIMKTKENILISTSYGLIFSNNYIISKINRPLGGILVMRVIVK